MKYREVSAEGAGRVATAYSADKYKDQNEENKLAG